MIINTGSRTDIPAYFSEWFYNRIQEGAVMARNPYQPAQVQRFLLNPQVVDGLVFRTKNPGPMLERFGELMRVCPLYSRLRLIFDLPVLQ